MTFVYILYSKKLNKFYTGFTELSVTERIKRHLDKYYGNKFTASADDWELFLSIACTSKSQGLQVEKHIKRMKSKVYIQNLKKYPEMVLKLLEKMEEN